MTHNVVDDAAQALALADVQLPAGVKPFASGYLQPGQVFSHTFTVPGVYRYVCTLHETAGMKGVVIVTPSGANLASNSGTGYRFRQISAAGQAWAINPRSRLTFIRCSR